MGRSLGEQTRQAQLVLGRSEQQPCAPATPPPGGGGRIGWMPGSRVRSSALPLSLQGPRGWLVGEKAGPV